MASLKIEAHDKDKGLYLIKADDLFLKETFGQVKPAKRPGTPPTAFSLGNLDKNKTKISSIRNYPYPRFPGDLDIEDLPGTVSSKRRHRAKTTVIVKPSRRSSFGMIPLPTRQRSPGCRRAAGTRCVNRQDRLACQTEHGPVLVDAAGDRHAPRPAGHRLRQQRHRRLRPGRRP